MRKTIIDTICIFLAVCSISTHCFAQRAKMNPFEVRKSALVEQIKSLRAANPKMTSLELADAANLLLDKSGIGFAFSFDPTTCERLRQLKAQQKDPNTPLKLGATLKGSKLI